MPPCSHAPMPFCPHAPHVLPSCTHDHACISMPPCPHPPPMSPSVCPHAPMPPCPHSAPWNIILSCRSEIGGDAENSREGILQTLIQMYIQREEAMKDDDPDLSSWVVPDVPENGWECAFKLEASRQRRQVNAREVERWGEGGVAGESEGGQVDAAWQCQGGGGRRGEVERIR